MRCPRCEAEVTGRFCGYCGGALESRGCRSCDAEIPPGHRFCSECGVEAGGAPPPAPESSPTGGPVPEGGRSGPGAAPPSTDETSSARSSPSVHATTSAGASDAPPVHEEPATGGAARGDNRTAWWVAGIAAVATALVLAVPYLWTSWPESGGGERVPLDAGAPGQAAAPGQAGPAGGGTGVDLSTMTPREAADRLYDRVMRAVERNDQAEVEQFLPMARDAYALARPLDADGHFHVSLLEQVAGEHDRALETAEAVLSSDPDHLLLLYAGAEAARALGDDDRAREYHGRVLDVFEEESARDRPEYREHEAFLPTVRETAREFLGVENG